MACGEPVIAEPDVIGGIPLAGECGFLCMFTNGLYKSLEEATATTHVNHDIAYMVAAEFNIQSSLSGVAQGVVDKVLRIHHDTYLQNNVRAKFCGKRDDITLLVRNFNYPLGNALKQAATISSSYRPVTVPYNQSKIPYRPPTLYIPLPTPQPSDTTPTLMRASTSPVSSSPVSSPQASTTESQESSYQDRSSSPSTQNTNSSGDNDSKSNMVSCIINTISSKEDVEEEPDADGMMKPYVDFTDFITRYNAVIANLE